MGTGAKKKLKGKHRGTPAQRVDNAHGLLSVMSVLGFTAQIQYWIDLAGK